MIDFAALRLRTGLHRDCRCICGSNVFGVFPLIVTNYDGRTLTSNLAGGIACSIYILLCSCGLQYYLSALPEEQENTLIPVASPEAKEFLEPSMPDFSIPGPDVELPKET